MTHPKAETDMNEPKTIADVLDKSIDKLSAVAEAIQKAAPDFWRSSVRGHRIEGITHLVIWLAVATIAALGMRAFFREMRKDRCDQADSAIPAMIVGCIAAVIAIIAALSSGGDTVNKVINPEWFAAWDLIRAVKP